MFLRLDCRIPRRYRQLAKSVFVQKLSRLMYAPILIVSLMFWFVDLCPAALGVDVLRQGYLQLMAIAAQSGRYIRTVSFNT